MPRYLVVRSFEVGEEQMPPIGRRSRELVEGDFPEITWEHSHVIVDDEGLVHTYCIYAAPSEEIVREHAKKLGRHTIDELYEVAGDVTPADFPPVEG
jgi:Nickel responsive protein SCO4226-like